MNKTDIFNTKKILKNNPKIDLDLIEASDKLRNSPFCNPHTPEYTLLPALGTEEGRLNNMANIYHLGR